MDNHTITDYKWYTSGKSYSGSSSTIIDGHIKHHCTGPTQNSMCVQQNSYGQFSNLEKKTTLLLRGKLPFFKSMPCLRMLDHKRYTNKIEFGSESSKANLQVNIQVLQTDGSTSDQNTPKLDSRMNISHNYVAPIRKTYETLDKLENVNVRVPYN